MGRGVGCKVWGLFDLPLLHLTYTRHGIRLMCPIGGAVYRTSGLRFAHYMLDHFGHAWSRRQPSARRGEARLKHRSYPVYTKMRWVLHFLCCTLWTMTCMVIAHGCSCRCDYWFCGIMFIHFKFDASRRRKKVLKSSRDKNVRHEP